MSVNYLAAGYSWEYWYRPLSSNMDLYCSQQFNIFVLPQSVSFWLLQSCCQPNSMFWKCHSLSSG